MLTVVTKTLHFKTRGNADMVDLTDHIDALIKHGNIESGTVTPFVPGSTGAVISIEYEPGVLNDLRKAVDRFAPEDIEYEHNLRWGDGNGHSHVRSALLGPSITVPFVGKKLLLGTWQQIVFVDLDNRERSRKILVTIMGE